MLLLIAGMNLKEHKILQQQQRAIAVEGQYGNSTPLTL
jgi:hypothetical protein